MALLKNKKKTAPPPNWRPDFRDLATLPDTKVVRTDFLLNFVAITLAAGLLAYLVVMEYNLRTLATGLQTLETQIQGLTAENRKNLTLSGQFTQTARPLEQVIAFRRTPFMISEILVTLADIKPEEIVLMSVVMQPTVLRDGRRELPRRQLTLQGSVLDLVDQPATQTIADFQTEVSRLPMIAPQLEAITLAGLVRSTDSQGTFNFTLQILLDPDKK